eukprot:TRINITY_DN18335_c0_g1_i6.p1 TRINITY_DN18335_c0_g1~~TRINITY_DN18335_c0_g1_i6.p1  ORF type:complete len:263 (+),score=53.28 TRINITY_DN18335_c0_g1_i6:90-878(+)
MQYRFICFFFFFFQAEDGIRDAQESRGLGDVYKRQQLREGDFTDPEPGCDKDWPTCCERMSTLVSKAVSSSDPLVAAAASTGLKVDVLHNNNGSNQHDQGFPDDGNQSWMGKTANGEKYPVDRNGWHTGYLVRRLRKNHPGKDEPKGKYECWYEVALLMSEYGGSPQSSLVAYPGPQGKFAGRVHSSMKKNFFGGDAIRPYSGTAEFEDIPIDASWECNGAAAWHLQGQADCHAARAARTGSQTEAAMAADAQAKADKLRNN